LALACSNIISIIPECHVQVLRQKFNIGPDVL